MCCVLCGDGVGKDRLRSGLSWCMLIKQSVVVASCRGLHALSEAGANRCDSGLRKVLGGVTAVAIGTVTRALQVVMSTVSG